MIFYAIADAIGLLVNIIIMIVIVQFVLSLLVMFNVVSMSNDAVRTILQALNAVLDPFLAPIRRILPDTGVLDLSPIVLIIGMNLLAVLVASIPAALA